MAYATRSDIEAIYGAGFLQTLVAADLDFDAAVTRACAASSAEIDSYLGQRYTLPLSVSPEIVRTWCVDIACWRLAGTITSMSEETRKRAERALGILKDVAAGKASVPGLEGSQIAGPAGSEVSAGGSTGAAFTSRRRRWGGTGGGL